MRRGFPVALVWLILGVPAFAETAVLPCTRDASLQPGTKVTELDLRRPVLVDFLFSVASQWRVRKAILLIHLASGSPPRSVGIGLIQRPWSELRPENQPFKFVRHRVSPQEDGWVRVEIKPALVEALSTGKAHGFALGDVSAVAVLHSRESGQFAPYLIVEGEPR